MTDLVDLEQAERTQDSCPTPAESPNNPRQSFLSWGRFTMNSSGLTVKRDQGGKRTETLVCRAFEVLGHARDPRGRGWGRWLRWLDADGRMHERYVPDADLQRDPASLCAM